MTIKKCPFCGSKNCYATAATNLSISKTFLERFVMCTSCECRGPLSYDQDSNNAAISAWNAAPRKKREKKQRANFCAIHGVKLQRVRPGEWQCVECEFDKQTKSQYDDPGE